MATQEPVPFKRRFARPGDKVDLGDVGITSSAVDVLAPEEAASAVRRHAQGDWGSVEDLPENDRALLEGLLVENERALREGGWLVSVYRTAGGITFWVITDPDRSATMVRLPEED